MTDPNQNQQACKRCGERAKKIAAPVWILDRGKYVPVCGFCAETRWWEGEKV